MPVRNKKYAKLLYLFIVSAAGENSIVDLLRLSNKFCDEIESDRKCRNAYPGITSGSEFIAVQFSMAHKI